MMKIEIPYYEDNTRISNSNIGQYLKYGPLYLRNYLDNKEDRFTASYLDKGTMVHMYLLQPEDFNKEYVVTPFNTPKSKQQKDFVLQYINLAKTECLEDKDKLKIQAYKIAYSNSKTDNKCLEDANNILGSYKEYLDFIFNNDPRIQISESQRTGLRNIKKRVKEHKLANRLLFEMPETTECHNEFHINWEFPKNYYGLNVACKSLLDRVCIDTTTKNITLIDVKTTASLYEFEHSMETYDYARQLAYYWMAIQWYMLNERKINVFDEDYSFETYIIAIDSTGRNDVRVFEIKPKMVEDRVSTIVDAISDIAFHIKNNLWDHKKEYYNGDGAEQIKI